MFIGSLIVRVYAIETKVLKHAVNRNIDRFSADGMFALGRDEKRFNLYALSTTSPDVSIALSHPRTLESLAPGTLSPN